MNAKPNASQPRFNDFVTRRSRRAERRVGFAGAGALLAALVLNAAPAAAQADACAGALSPAAIVGCLRPGGTDGGTRGIRPAANSPGTISPGTISSGGTGPGRASATSTTAATVNLSITFGVDSAKLTAEGASALTSLGLALKDPALADARFLIGGHTDAAGSVEHNQALSERRAETARRFLVERTGVAAARLTTVGFGLSRLYDAGNPMSSVNRRVQVSRL